MHTNKHKAMFSKVDIIEMILNIQPDLEEAMRQGLYRIYLTYSPAKLVEVYNYGFIEHVKNEKTLKIEPRKKTGYDIQYMGSGLFSIKY
jgi:hypothetical protein